MDEISTDNFSAIEMDKRPVSVNHSMDTRFELDGHTSERRNLRSAVVKNLSQAASGQKEMKSSKPEKNRSTSAKTATGKSSKPTGSPAKKVAKPKASRSKSPTKKTATTKAKKLRKSSKGAGVKKQKVKTAAKSPKKK